MAVAAMISGTSHPVDAWMLGDLIYDKGDECGGVV